jgi:hypothetical protein
MRPDSGRARQWLVPTDRSYVSTAVCSYGRGDEPRDHVGAEPAGVERQPPLAR